MVWLGGAVEPIAAPVLADPRFGGAPLYCSDVIVRSESRYRAFADLAGSRWAVNEPSSWSGYWGTLARVRSWSHFSRVITAGSHQRALEMVADGSVDGAAIDCQVLAVALRDLPDLRSRIRIIDSVGRAPIQPVVVRSTLAAALKEQVRNRLLELRHPTLDHYFVQRFVAPPDYGSIATQLLAMQPVTGSGGLA